MSYTWKTEMRATTASGPETNEEYEQLKAAREADRLRGQAAMGWLGDGRVQLTVMPDRGCFPAECVVSVEDARALAHAILDADRHALEAKPLARVEIIDVAAHARELYGDDGYAAIAGRPVPEHDYRFRGVTPEGGETGYHDGATAAHIIAAIEHDRALKAKGL